MELLKDYDMIILYHLRKANVVADALRRNLAENLAMLITTELLLVKMQWLELEVVTYETSIELMALVLQPTPLERIK